MSWGAGGRHLDEMLHIAAVADQQRHAATRRAAALTIAAHLGPDCRDILDALGLTGPIEQPVPYRRERILHHGGRLVGHRIGGGAR
jgi:hypothetical protein